MTTEAIVHFVTQHYEGLFYFSLVGVLTCGAFIIFLSVWRGKGGEAAESSGPTHHQKTAAANFSPPSRSSTFAGTAEGPPEVREVARTSPESPLAPEAATPAHFIHSNVVPFPGAGQSVGQSASRLAEPSGSPFTQGMVGSAGLGESVRSPHEHRPEMGASAMPLGATPTPTPMASSIGAASPSPGPTTAKAAEFDDRPELLSRIRELEAKLFEYGVIEEDIADLSNYKRENEELKAELASLRQSAPPTSAPPPPGPIAAPAGQDILGEFAVSGDADGEAEAAFLDTEKMVAEMAELSALVDTDAANTESALDEDLDLDKVALEATGFGKD